MKLSISSSLLIVRATLLLILTGHQNDHQLLRLANLRHTSFVTFRQHQLDDANLTISCNLIQRRIRMRNPGLQDPAKRAHHPVHLARTSQYISCGTVETSTWSLFAATVPVANGVDAGHENCSSLKREPATCCVRGFLHGKDSVAASVPKRLAAGY